MKSVDILITNYNSGETIQLCIESIRRFTDHPHRIIVCDDLTDSRYYDDLTYLRSAHDKGWLTLLENSDRRGHGHTLARLLDFCASDLAMVLDCDIQIKAKGWLEAMVTAQAKENAAMVAGLESFPDGNVAFSSWFFMLDMAQYPHIKDEWDYTRRRDGWRDAQGNPGWRPTGYLIWEKIMAQKRPIEPIPLSVKASYFHHCHISVLSLPQEGPCWAVRQQRYAVIQNELTKLRKMP